MELDPDLGSQTTGLTTGTGDVGRLITEADRRAGRGGGGLFIVTGPWDDEEESRFFVTGSAVTGELWLVGSVLTNVVRSRLKVGFGKAGAAIWGEGSSLTVTDLCGNVGILSFNFWSCHVDRGVLR